MIDIDQLFTEVKQEALERGVVFDPPATISINGRLTACWGRCVTKRRTGYDTVNSIQLSKRLVDSGNITAIKNTIAHELIHSGHPEDGHGLVFWREASKFGDLYEIKRIATEKELLGTETVSKQPKYVLKCLECGEELHYNRMCSAVKNPGGYRHKGCNGLLVRIK